MEEQIKKLFAENGYYFMQGRPQNAAIFYKKTEQGCKVFLVINEVERLQLSVLQLQNMIHNVIAFFHHPNAYVLDLFGGCAPDVVEMQTLLIGYQPDNLPILCTNVDNVWAYDMGRGKLMVYERQSQDFDGLRAELEQILQKSRKKMVTQNSEFGQAMQKWGATIGIVAVNVLVFVILEIIGDTQNPDFMLQAGASYPTNIKESGECWRLFTCMFLHFGLPHLLNNMVMLSCAGARLEEALGHVKFLLLYLIAGLGGSILSHIEMLYRNDYAVSAGASGAIFGVIGGLLWVIIRNKGRYETMTTKGMLFMIALCLYFGITTAGVDNWAHLGGLIMGFLLGILLYRKKGKAGGYY